LMSRSRSNVERIPMRSAQSRKSFRSETVSKLSSNEW
jgi:hypothetical protein